MITLLSPAKTLDMDPVDRDLPSTAPPFPGDTKKLIRRARELSPADIRKLMGVSETLADLNHQRFKKFKMTPKLVDGKPAALAFKGDVYLGLDAASLDDEDLLFAQDNVRLLSGLYGILRPLDRMQPYRLEMGLPLSNERGKNLYQFWGAKIAKVIKKELAAHPDATVVNLASNEYFKAVDKKALKARIVTPVFKEVKDGKPKIISFLAKKSRGMMTRYIIQERLSDPEELKGFKVDRFRFQPKLSTDDRWEFHRKFIPVGG